MKSFNEHIDNKPKKLKEDPLDDLGSLLTVAAVGGGLWALKKVGINGVKVQHCQINLLLLKNKKQMLLKIK